MYALLLLTKTTRFTLKLTRDFYFKIFELKYNFSINAASFVHVRLTTSWIMPEIWSSSYTLATFYY